MRSARIICVGKLKTDYWKQSCAHYLKMLAPFRAIEVLEVRDADASLDEGARRRQEGERLIAALGRNDWPIAMWEGGKMLDSRGFAGMLKECDEHKLLVPAFLIGGPFGLSDAVLEAVACKLSLSLLTWPHELARVMLIEQLYRAETILRNGPYHH